MLKLFIIGGMGAGKSTARLALVECGLPYIDLDSLGHEVLKHDKVKKELAQEFGDDILDEEKEIIRKVLAERAFADEERTHRLNAITMPRIEEIFRDRILQLEKERHEAAAVECSVFSHRAFSIASEADVVIAIVAPIEKRIERAVASGFDRVDVRRRMARQISDAERIDQADVVFNNDADPQDLQKKIIDWWNEYRESLI